MGARSGPRRVRLRCSPGCALLLGTMTGSALAAVLYAAAAGREPTGRPELFLCDLALAALCGAICGALFALGIADACNRPGGAAGSAVTFHGESG